MHLGGVVAASLVLALAAARRRVSLLARVPGSPLLGRGLPGSRADGDRVDDWADVEFWLPAARARLAEPLLAGLPCR